MSEIKLDTHLSQSEAAKTKLFSLLSESGIIAECENILCTNPKFIFSQWKFDDIKNENDKVIFCGVSEADTPAINLFDTENNYDSPEKNAEHQTRWQELVASYAICAAYSQAMAENIPIPINGAGGIFFGFSGKKITLLFMPEKLFDTVCTFYGAEKYWKKQSSWISPIKSTARTATVDNATIASASANAAASDTSANARNIAFAQSTVAYYALTQTMPFALSNAENFAQDIRDKNFMLLEHKINGIDENLASEIDNALRMSGKVFSVETLETFRRESGLTENENEIAEPERANKIPEKEFAEKVKAIYESKQTRVSAKRKLQRNKIIIIAAMIAIFVTVATIIGAHESSKLKPTTIGLTSIETATLFYKAIHTLDNELLSAASKGKVTKIFANTIANIYVTGKMRSAYGGQNYITPEEWLATETPQMETPVYGIINFTLDGKQISPVSIKAPTNENHSPALTGENGTQLSKGAQKKYNAKYSIMILDAAANISQNIQYDETVTLTFNGKRWRVTDVMEN